ncbi:MAG: choice-of-anchor B family protein [Saprospiraceae bacterium]|nr:choice-of-anchor B family protein [Saprospiraceae bacterium]
MKCHIYILAISCIIPVSIWAQPCQNGMVGAYPCKEIALQSRLTLPELGATGDGNDIWGWWDTLTGKEYALVGLFNGTAFVDISDPSNPIRLGNLPTHTVNSIWRDIKVYKNHAYIVSEATGHGLQVFDLTRLRTVTNPPVIFTEDGWVGFAGGNAHNVIVNEETGFIYTVGTRSNCAGGIVYFDVSNPKSPVMKDCYSTDGYSHDAVCFVYRGPDTLHIGKEICIGFNEDTYTIIDVSDKENTEQISRNSYVGSRYSHQGWITDDHRYLLLDDELDEGGFFHNTKTYLFDISNLSTPIYLGAFFNTTQAIDHNQYIKGRYVYQANYRSGLRILDLAEVAQGELSEVGYFDIYTANNSRGYEGSWSVYPYFRSGNVLISGIDEGLFVVKPNIPHFNFTLNYPSVVELCQGTSGKFELDLTAYAGFSDMVQLQLSNLPSDLSAALSDTLVAPNSHLTLFLNASQQATAQNYSLLLTGMGNDSTSMQTIAMGVKIKQCPTVAVAPKVFLHGAYQPSNTSMEDHLRRLNILPKTPPFSDYNTTLQNYKANLSDDILASTGSDAIVDWVLVELRSDPQTVVARRAALLQKDGDVVDTDGMSPVKFTGVSTGNYYVAVSHRNHLKIMSANALTLIQE